MAPGTLCRSCDRFHGAAQEQYESLRENNIPIMVMEPAHGGMLADLLEVGRDLLSEQEVSLVRQVSDVIHVLYAVPYTGCRYCCADCPQQLDIPFLLSAYNEYKTGGEKDLSFWRLVRLGRIDRRKEAVRLYRLCHVYRPLSPGLGCTRLYERRWRRFYNKTLLNSKALRLSGLHHFISFR